MKWNRVVVAFSLCALTTSVLYLVGHIFTISIFMFRHEYIDYEGGYLFSTGSMIPLMIGLIKKWGMKKTACLNICKEKPFFYYFGNRLAI
ncbi:hypothetical protein [Bacillus sp. REN10]|uniref:hypothetical protein n=1 Tax=Bacillus sp. REN10 TaxID=2782541 RepID=UPI00193B8670|nr:hypothetical protein [Bacillus sp. REN10]